MGVAAAGTIRSEASMRSRRVLRTADTTPTHDTMTTSLVEVEASTPMPVRPEFLARVHAILRAARNKPSMRTPEGATLPHA